MDKDKVSIIVPVYNVEKYIEKCLKSLISQSYKNIEIILIDDGSKDNSGKICDEYKRKDSRIKVVHKENAGVSEARNSGLQEATGEYICFVDADDFVMNDYIEYMYELIVNNSSDIAICTKMFSNFDEKQTSYEVIETLNGENTIIRILNYRIPIGVYSKIFKKDLINDNKIRFFKDIYMGEGFNFNVSCFQRAKKVMISNHKVYYYRRDNNTSATTKFSIKKCENSLYAMEVMNDNLIIRTERVINSLEYAIWRTYSDAFDYMCLGNGKKDNLDKFKEYKNYIKNNYKTYKKVDISKKDKFRAILMGIFPGIIPFLLKCRRFIYKIKI